MADGTSTSYRLLPVRLLGSGQPSIVRYLYIKQHASAQDGLPKERALFVAGVPAALQGPALVDLFAKFGEVERAAMHGSRVSAVLLYAAAEGLERLLKAAAKGKPLEQHVPEPQGPCGLKSWVEEHKAAKPGNSELQAALDEWMAEWEEEEERRREEALLAPADDDGWTVVQRHKGRKKNASATGVTVGGVAGAAAATQLAESKKKDSTHKDFYRFQQREHRRNELLDLRTKFEQDKKRIADLRASRKWRPY